MQRTLQLLALASCAAGAGKVKHIVVLMEENRSFDHMFGWRKGVNGVTGKETNPLDSFDPTAGSVRVSRNATQLAMCDPNHGLPGTTEKIFGKKNAAAKNFTEASMTGFVEVERHAQDYCQVMDLQTPESVPIMSSLADHFVLMDRFFASVPGPTWPNRMFMLAATSAGGTATGPWYREKGRLFPQKTFFDQLTESNRTWRNYYNDTPWEMFMEGIANQPQHTVSMEEFWRDAREGTLPSFSWINPRSGINVTMGVGSNDQHPDHDVAAGEAYYKDVYEALRSSPSWNETLLVVTYDEHGGYWDHVPTPLNVPAPGDGESSFPDSFAFDRLGVRIPTLLISPWLEKGLVQSGPPDAQKPAGNSEYDLTSIMATARKLLGMPETPLTKRDAWAATFEHLFSRDEPRTDCPVHLPAAVPPSQAALAAEAGFPTNSLQEHIMEVHAHHAGTAYPHHVKQQRHVSEWLQTALATHKARKATTLPVVVAPGSATWKFNFAGGAARPPPGTVATVTTAVDGATYCLDGRRMEPGEPVVVAPCNATDPAAAPQSQQWVWGQDGSIRAHGDQAVCVDQVVGASTGWLGTRTTILAACAESVTQRYAYHGGAPGHPYTGKLYFGDDAGGLDVVTA
eukprot:TRINITY_DN1223_c0_g8_i2.p1 TRINITY_DN1223_c0_g8~~TRINITY_DN1223_c0_g8_i2.p1  ORF type:complete len:626 (+),score=200.26 TRINITY_DN1223_c0_g8_i2:65-1942(+)